MRRITTLAVVAGCALAPLAGSSAAASMKPQTVTGKVELVNAGKHAFALTVLHMELIHVTASTRWASGLTLKSLHKGEKLKVTVVEHGPMSYTATHVEKAM
jgi:hypothetical protein